MRLILFLSSFTNGKKNEGKGRLNIYLSSHSWVGMLLFEQFDVIAYTLYLYTRYSSRAVSGVYMMF